MRGTLATRAARSVTRVSPIACALVGAKPPMCTRWFDYPIKEVFALLAQPDFLVTRDEAALRVHQFELRQHGRVLVEGAEAGEQAIRIAGRFVAYEPPSRLAIEFSAGDCRFTDLAGSRLVITLTECSGGARLDLWHTPPGH